jgi:hypothetical protein
MRHIAIGSCCLLLTFAAGCEDDDHRVPRQDWDSYAGRWESSRTEGCFYPSHGIIVYVDVAEANGAVRLTWFAEMDGNLTQTGSDGPFLWETDHVIEWASGGWLRRLEFTTPTTGTIGLASRSMDEGHDGYIYRQP